MRYDMQQILQWIPPGARVLDLGCGQGEFLQLLRRERQTEGIGVEIAHDNITACLRAGLQVLKHDLSTGLKIFDDNSFDAVVMAYTLQEVSTPLQVIDEMLRIGQECMIAFHNFAYWRCRLDLGLHGRMPLTHALPSNWHDTPNIHLCTLHNFEELCREHGIHILDRIAASDSRAASHSRPGLFLRRWPNLFAVSALYRISR